MKYHRADDHHGDYDGQISFAELLDWMLKRELWVDPGYQAILDFVQDDVQIRAPQAGGPRLLLTPH